MDGLNYNIIIENNKDIICIYYESFKTKTLICKINTNNNTLTYTRDNNINLLFDSLRLLGSIIKPTISSSNNIDINQFKRTIWHKYPEQPDPDRLILLYNGIKCYGLDYDIAYYKKINKNSMFIYMDDILLPNMIKALHKQEKELDQEFS